MSIVFIEEIDAYFGFFHHDWPFGGLARFMTCLYYSHDAYGAGTLRHSESIAAAGAGCKIHS